MTQPSLTPAAFAAKWHGVTTTEKAAAQEHFIDLCRMLGEPTAKAALSDRITAASCRPSRRKATGAVMFVSRPSTIRAAGAETAAIGAAGPPR
jgi:hypothetical protein